MTAAATTAVVAGAVAAVAWAARDIPVAMGGRPTGERGERVRRSPRFKDGAFRNPVPASTFPRGSGTQTLREMFASRGRRTPSGPIPLATPTSTDPAGADSLHITWYGHASTLVELDGARLLVDPVWSERCSPSGLAGPRQLHPVPLSLDQLPELDAIVISHDHYDHLDLPTVRALTRSQRAPFVVPLGVGAHLDRWQVPADRIIELDWEEETVVNGVRLVATAARHFSGRGFSRDQTLWASWVFAGEHRRVFYSGDSGYFDGYATIGAEHGPFDATLIQIGAYGVGWPDIHMTPEDGVKAHIALRGELLIPVHWATFNLSVHGWTDPADRVWLEAKARDVTLAVPRPGERVDVDNPPAVDGWWQTLG